MDPFATPTEMSLEDDYFSMPVDNTPNNEPSSVVMDPEQAPSTKKEGKKRVGFSSFGPEIDPVQEQKLRSALKAQQAASDLNSELNSRRSSFNPAGADALNEMDGLPPPERQEEKSSSGLLSMLLKLHGISSLHSLNGSLNPSAASTPASSPPPSGTVTPSYGGQRALKQWLKPQYGSQTHSPEGSRSPHLEQLVGSTSMLAMRGDLGQEVTERLKASKRPPMHKRSRSGQSLQAAFSKWTKPKSEDQKKLKHRMDNLKNSQVYLQTLCVALMEYGAPTHRLEEYLRLSAADLEVKAQFLYIPGSMIISFDDAATHTAELRLIRTAQGVNLGKLRDAHEVYKEVVRQNIGVEEATHRLQQIHERKVVFNVWILILVQGLAAMTVAPFAFGGRLIDLPAAFMLGLLVGFLQHFLAPRTEVFSNLFEIIAVVLTSFLSRALGSMRGGNLFCFSALFQSSIATILPGYTILCASVELQSRSIIAGSVRLVYAIIYSLFIGFSITVGSVLYAIVDPDATSVTTCSNPMNTRTAFLFVPLFTMCLIVLNQAKWRQAPVMVIIAFAGYIVNVFAAEGPFRGNTQISSVIGACVIGVMANLYTRLGGTMEKGIRYWGKKKEKRAAEDAETGNGGSEKQESEKRAPYTRLGSFENVARLWSKRKECSSTSGNRRRSGTESSSPSPPKKDRKVAYCLAAANMLPAIWVQVPSGLSASGALVSGITAADQIAHNATGTTVVTGTTQSNFDSTAFMVAGSVVQIALGITVGLFLSTLLVYPLGVGRKRSALFTF